MEYKLTKFKEQLVELDLPTPSMPKDHEVGLEVSDDATRNGELPKMPKLPSMDVPLNIQLDRLASYLDDFETAFEAIRAYIEKEFGIHEKFNLGIKNKLGHIDTSFKKNAELMDRLEHRKVNALLQLSGRLLRLHNSGNHTFEGGRAAANEILQVGWCTFKFSGKSVACSACRLLSRFRPPPIFNFWPFTGTRGTVQTQACAKGSL